MGNGWSNYAKQQMPQIAVGAVTAPTFHLALYQGSANPDGGNTPAEVTVPGYARQFVRFKVSGGNIVCSGKPTIPPASADYEFTGIGIVDNQSNIWFWDDNHGIADVPAHTALAFAANAIVITPSS